MLAIRGKNRIITAVIIFAITAVIFVQSAPAAEMNAQSAAPAATRAETSVAPVAPVPVQKAAPETADLVIFAGQSNMAGMGGTAALAPAVPEAAGYEYRPLSDPGSLHAITEPFGARESTIPSGVGSMVSSFILTYYARTGVPVIAVSAARAATDSAYWASAGAKNALLDKFIRTRSYMQLNNIRLRRAFVVWQQGESDAMEGVSIEQYKANLLAAFSPLFANGLERVYVITPGKSKGNIVSYDAIIQAQIDLCLNDPRFTLATTQLHSMGESALKDELHYGQGALNTIGAAAANAAAQ